MNNGKLSQTELLIRHMLTNSHITALQALGLYRVFNMKGRIHDLRKAGWNIETDMQTDATGKTYARYSVGVPVRFGHAEAA